MKSAVIYYSLDGNTKYAAEKIADRLGADLIRLIPAKEYPTGKKIGLFACCSGGKTEKCFEQMKKEAGDCNMVSTVQLIEPLKAVEADVDRSISDFCAILEREH